MKDSDVANRGMVPLSVMSFLMFREKHLFFAAKIALEIYVFPSVKHRHGGPTLPLGRDRFPKRPQRRDPVTWEVPIPHGLPSRKIATMPVHGGCRVGLRGPNKEKEVPGSPPRSRNDRLME